MLLQAIICYSFQSFVSDYSEHVIKGFSSTDRAMGMLIALLCNLYGGD